MPIFEALRAIHVAENLHVLTNYPELYEGHPFVDAVNVVPKSVDRYVLLRGAPRDVFRIAHYAQCARVEAPVWRPHLFFDDWRKHPPLPEGEGPLVAVSAGASWTTKQWPIERWRALCTQLEAGGCRVVELGKDDEPIGVPNSLMGRTDVRQAACVLHHADLFVGCDSGLMHLALAAATPAVALFGPTDPDILIRDEPNFYPIRSGQSCSGHWNRPGGDPKPGVCPEGHACCLDDITVDDVLARIQERIVFPNRDA